MDSEFSNISPKEEDQESVYSWQGYETGKGPIFLFIQERNLELECFFFSMGS